MSKKRTLTVKSSERGWVVQYRGAARALRVLPSKREATAFAKSAAQRAQVDLLIYNADGKPGQTIKAKAPSPPARSSARSTSKKRTPRSPRGSASKARPAARRAKVPVITWDRNRQDEWLLITFFPSHGRPPYGAGSRRTQVPIEGLKSAFTVKTQVLGLFESERRFWKKLSVHLERYMTEGCWA